MRTCDIKVPGIETTSITDVAVYEDALRHLSEKVVMKAPEGAYQKMSLSEVTVSLEI